jgi:uncharacterized protein
MMRKVFGIAALSGLVFIACKKPKTQEDEKFDRGLMLKNYAENIIIPSYKDAQSSVNQLITSIDAFTANTTLQNLENAQNAWVNAYGEWQYANPFNVGPAAEDGLNKSMFEEVSTFPVSETKINDAVINGVYSFSDFNRDARGFLAIEYLLFGAITETNDDVLNLFATQTHRKIYLKECAKNIKSKIDNVVNKWTTSFINDFIKNNSTDVGSSTSQLYNEFLKSFEVNKNFKIELPMGLRVGQTQAEPQLVEAYYSGKSLHFLKIHLKSIENIYYGKTKSGTDGLGFKDYLETVTGGKDLVASTLLQWKNVINSLNAIPTTQSLSELIINNPQPIEDFRVELQKHTRFFKSDMSSLLGIAITYSSGDGD